VLALDRLRSREPDRARTLRCADPRLHERLPGGEGLVARADGAPRASLPGHHGRAPLVPVSRAHLRGSARRAHRSPRRSTADRVRVPSLRLLVVPQVSAARVPAAPAGGVGMTNVLVLGGSGMLGSMVVDVLSRNPALNV